MNVDVEIYMNNIKKFFKDNPNDLKNLIPISKEKIFYEKIKEVAENNVKDNKDVPLTQRQLLEICVEINNKKPILQTETTYPYFESKFGKICLN